MSACAPKVIPAPIVTAPRFPAFVKPPVPSALASERGADAYERGWQFLQAGDFRTAGRELTSALRLSPAFFPAEAASGYLDLARADAKTALTHFDRVLAQQADYASALVGRGEALVALGREPEAIAALTAAVAADSALADIPRRIEVLRFRGVERSLQAARQAARSNDLEEAIRGYQSAIAASPDSAFLYRELGAVEKQRGEADLALDHFRKAVELDPSDAASYAQIGELLEARGDVSGGLSAYSRSLALEPSDAVDERRRALAARADLARLPEEYRAIDKAPQVTRADLAALIGVRLRAVLQTMQARDPGVATDVRTSWAESWIMAVVVAGVMEPFANHTFEPRTVVRRIDLAEAVSRLLARIAAPADIKRWASTPVRFPDLAGNHLSYPAASAAVASGVLPAAADGAFQPSRPVSGSEAVAVIDRLQALAAAPAAPRDTPR